MSSRPRPTWFRFSLRSLFVLVTLVGVWLGYQMSIVRERQELRRSIVVRGGEIRDTDPSAARMPDIMDVPWYRRLLGDRAVASVYLRGDDVTPADVRTAMLAFPEAEVFGRFAASTIYYRVRDLTGKLETLGPPPTDTD